ncbi:MAG TPA: thioredoxin family protein [Polyangiaceae bacterium]|jgi:peroxiredoxin
MALESNKNSLGSQCPDFRLPAALGGTVSRDDFANVPVLGVFFYCNHCPYAQAIETRLIELERDYRDRGFRFVAISPNDAKTHPDDSFPNMKRRATERGYAFPYLYDEDQTVARAFDAVCTPDLYIFDRDRKLAYHGRLDDSPRDPSKVRRHELREAVDALLAGRKPSDEQNPAIGCSIKWK